MVRGNIRTSKQVDSVLKALPGDKLVCFTFDAGYEIEAVLAEKLLKIGGSYTVSSIAVTGCRSSVRLREVDGNFNTVFFVTDEDYHDLPEDDKKTTFGQLDVGDLFIAFPTLGDNCGHGGYLNGAILLVKTGRSKEKTQGKAKPFGRSPESDYPDSMEVLRIFVH